MSGVGRIGGWEPYFSFGLAPELDEPDELNPEPKSKKSSGRAVAVPIDARSARDYLKPTGRAAATFLAQLIANHQRLPQTRQRRRVEPREAAEIYDAVARMTQPSGLTEAAIR